MPWNSSACTPAPRSVPSMLERRALMYHSLATAFGSEPARQQMDTAPEPEEPSGELEVEHGEGLGPSGSRGRTTSVYRLGLGAGL